MNILTSVVVSSVVAAVVSGTFQWFGQRAERKSRKQELLFKAALAMSDKDIEDQAKTNQKYVPPDRIEHASERYKKLKSLYDKGKLSKEAFDAD